MARAIVSRLEISGRLVAETPIHVGGSKTNGIVDLVPAVDGAGDFYLPGTSIAGVLRSWLVAEIDDERAAEPVSDCGILDEWWGYVGPSSSGSGHASRIVVDDAPVKLPKGSFQEVRDGVGIQRRSGAAAKRIKFDRAVLPVGSEAPFHLVVDCVDAAAEPTARAMIATLVDGLESGSLRFGAATTRGLGRMRLKDAQVHRFALRTREGVLAAIRGAGTEVPIGEDEPRLPAAKRPGWSVVIGWKPDGPLMVASGDEGLAVDHLPLVSQLNGGVALTLPGSSVKGALRSQAERIVRTVLGVRAAEAESDTSFGTDMEVPLVSWLFGSVGDDDDDQAGYRDEQAGESRQPRPGRGALSVEDCFAQRLNAGDWEKLQNSDAVADALGALDAAGLPQAQIAYHVAVDRWTAAPADGLLFSTLEPFAADWGPIRVDIDLTRVPLAERAPALALLVLVLRDFAEGRIPLGFAVNRGMGGVKATRLDFTARDVESLASGPSEWPVDPAWTGWPAGLLDDLGEAWRQWVQKQSEKEAESHV